MKLVKSIKSCKCGCGRTPIFSGGLHLICWRKKNASSYKLKKSKPNNVSNKRKAENPIYSKERVVFLTENPYCLAGGIINANISNHKCGKEATDVHHKKGRGIYLLVKKFWLPTCRNCHDFITENSSEAIGWGLSLVRNTEYNRLSKVTNNIT